jgi:hypothetical protein
VVTVPVRDFDASIGENSALEPSGRIVLFAGALLLLSLAGGASAIVSHTEVSSDAIRSSVTRSEAEVEKALKLPVASTSRGK